MVRQRSRHPVLDLALIVVVILLGLGSRRFGHSLPGFVAAYAGDTPWALVAFLGIGLLLPRASTWRVALLGVLFSAAIEASQLYHAPWIDSIRTRSRGSTTGTRGREHFHHDGCRLIQVKQSGDH